MVSIVLFTTGSLVAALARSFTVLLVGRCIQGVGGGGILAMSMIVFTDIIPLRHRPKWYGTVQAAWALGTILGPFIGGLLVEHQIWRWIFYINLPFCGVGLVVVPLVVRLHTERTSFRERLLRVDWIGGAAFIAGMTSFLMAVSWGGIQFHWRSFRTLVPMVLGVGAVLASLLWERYGAREPFLRRNLFSNRSSVVTYLCSIAQGVLVR
jgi:MFS family permease